MSTAADTMRSAATLLRDRADAALKFVDAEGWWAPEVLQSALEGFIDGDAPCGEHEDAEHMAALDPTVAKAIAELLDAAADEYDRREAKYGADSLAAANPTALALVNLADTYLRGEES